MDNGLDDLFITDLEVNLASAYQRFQDTFQQEALEGVIHDYGQVDKMVEEGKLRASSLSRVKKVYLQFVTGLLKGRYTLGAAIQRRFIEEAITIKHDAMMDLLLGHESDTSGKLDWIRRAARVDWPAGIRKIHEFGLDVNAPDCNGLTALHCACSKETAMVLLAANAKVDARNNDGETPLHIAARKDNLAVMSTLIEHGANVNAHGQSNNTPINECKSADAARLLLVRGANVNAKSFVSGTALFRAVNDGLDDLVEELLQHNANVSASNGPNYLTALHCAQSAEIAYSLLSRGANVNVQDKDLRTPLHYARNEDIALRLLEWKADLDSRDNLGCSALHLTKSAPIARVLLARGAHVDGIDSEGKTALFYAESVEIAETLVSGNANVNFKDKEGRTPLHKIKSTEVADLLIICGADASAKAEHGCTVLTRPDLSSTLVSSLIVAGALQTDCDKYQKTALHYRQPEETVKLLYDYGADFNAKDRDGKTPLHYADEPEIISLLLSYGAEPTAQDNQGRCPLHLAVQAESIPKARLLCRGIGVRDNLRRTALHYAKSRDMVEILLKHGAGIPYLLCGIDRDGFQPLHLAKSGEVAELLLEHGARINPKTLNDLTPLHIAAYNGSREVVAALLKFGADVNILTKRGMTALDLAVDGDIYRRRDIPNPTPGSSSGASADHWARFDNGPSIVELIERHIIKLRAADLPVSDKNLQAVGYDVVNLSADDKSGLRRELRKLELRCKREILSMRNCSIGNSTLYNAFKYDLSCRTIHSSDSFWCAIDSIDLEYYREYGNWVESRMKLHKQLMRRLSGQRLT